MSTHHFKANLKWELKNKPENSTQRFYAKSHEISFEGKELLKVSAAKAFKGDPALLNPEDLLLSSVTSCHMMSYLFVCSQNNIEVLSYEDYSEAILEVNANGSGKITQIILKPIIKIKDSSQSELALSLHHKANELCFIANSCNFPIEHHATIETEN